MPTKALDRTVYTEENAARGERFALDLLWLEFSSNKLFWNADGLVNFALLDPGEGGLCVGEGGLCVFIYLSTYAVLDVVSKRFTCLPY